MIYLDNAATTQVLPEVVLEMTHILNTVYGNPSSTYQLGRQAKQLMEEARRTIATSIHAQPSEIIFTSGGTESNNMALMSLAFRNQKRHIISTTIEHPSIRNTLTYLENNGFDVTYLPVNEDGVVSIQDIKEAIQKDTNFITIMFVNNETGAIQPIHEIGKLIEQTDILLHTDAVQAYGYLPMNMFKENIAMLSVSGHKVYGPKGIGFLYVKKGTTLSPLLHGGGQEQGMRSGTENLANIVGFAKAIELLEPDKLNHHYKQLETFMFQLIKQYNIPVVMNGSLNPNLHISKIQNLWFKQIPAHKLLIQLDLENIFVSAGSACSAGSLQPSQVLLTMYPNQKERASESIRVSFSKYTTKEDIATFVEKLACYTV